jgi:hypothetical protein
MSLEPKQVSQGTPPSTKTQFVASPNIDNLAILQTRLRKGMRIVRREPSGPPPPSIAEPESEDIRETAGLPLRERSTDMLLAIASVGSLGWISYRWWQGK